jgi:RNA polymerase sigma-70 factor (ECF subfamily)
MAHRQTRNHMENTLEPIALSSEDPAVALPLAPHSGFSQPNAGSELEFLVLRLFDQCRGRLLSYVLTFGLSFPDAEDVVQESFLSLFRHLELGRPRTNLHGWLFRVAHNLALKRRAANRVSEEKLMDETVLNRVPCPAANAEEALAFHQSQRRLRAVFDALPEKERRCLFLRAEGLKYREIASIQNISLGAVSISISRALARMIACTGGGLDRAKQG